MRACIFLHRLFHCVNESALEFSRRSFTVSFALPGLSACSHHHGEVCEPAEKARFRRTQPVRAQSELQVALLVAFVIGAASPPRQEQGASIPPDTGWGQSPPAGRAMNLGVSRARSPPTGMGGRSLHRRKKGFGSLQRLQSHNWRDGVQPQPGH